jgi:hypothetical protein
MPLRVFNYRAEAKPPSHSHSSLPHLLLRVGSIQAGGTFAEGPSNERPKFFSKIIINIEFYYTISKNTISFFL